MNPHANGVLDDARIETLAAGAEIDMAGSEGCLFIIRWNAPANDNKADLHVGDESDGSDQAIGADSRTDVATELVSANSEPVTVIELHKPTKRYASIVLASGAGTILALKYGHRSIPVAQDVAKAVAAQFIGAA
ncbi:MAG: hypothetical protein AAFU85_11535 [Planctomycetota bacterium]